MSKSNNRYGKTLYTMRLALDANPQPNPKLIAQWRRLDEYAIKEYGRRYDELKSNEKVQLHFNINTKVYEKEAGK